MKNLTKLSALLLLVSIISSCSQKTPKELIVGKWQPTGLILLDDSKMDSYEMKKFKKVSEIMKLYTYEYFTDGSLKITALGEEMQTNYSFYNDFARIKMSLGPESGTDDFKVVVIAGDQMMLETTEEPITQIGFRRISGN